MTNGLSKAIMSKSKKTKNKYLNSPSRENFISYKKTKNKCNSFTKKAKRDLFKEATKMELWQTKNFGVLLNFFNK